MTLGVPRLIELLNCSKNPKTPSMMISVPVGTERYLRERVKEMLFEKCIQTWYIGFGKVKTKWFKEYCKFIDQHATLEGKWYLKYKCMDRMRLYVDKWSQMVLSQYFTTAKGVRKAECFYSNVCSETPLEIVFVFTLRRKSIEPLRMVHSTLMKSRVSGIMGVTDAYVLKEGVMATVGSNLKD